MSSQEADNQRNLQLMFTTIPEGGMRESLAGAVGEMKEHTLKEIYLALGRPCELVFTRKNGGKTEVKRSTEVRGVAVGGAG